MTAKTEDIVQFKALCTELSSVRTYPVPMVEIS